MSLCSVTLFAGDPEDPPEEALCSRGAPASPGPCTQAQPHDDTGPPPALPLGAHTQGGGPDREEKLGKRGLHRMSGARALKAHGTGESLGNGLLGSGSRGSGLAHRPGGRSRICTFNRCLPPPPPLPAVLTHSEKLHLREVLAGDGVWGPR